MYIDVPGKLPAKSLFQTQQHSQVVTVHKTRNFRLWKQEKKHRDTESEGKKIPDISCWLTAVSVYVYRELEFDRNSLDVLL